MVGPQALGGGTHNRIVCDIVVRNKGSGRRLLRFETFFYLLLALFPHLQNANNNSPYLSVGWLRRVKCA